MRDPANNNMVVMESPEVINRNNLRRMRRARVSFANAGLTGFRFGRPNASNYIQNENRMKNDTNKNDKNKRITWKQNIVKNLPTDPVSTNNFKSGEKAVKINKLYLSPNSFRKMARMSMVDAINNNGNMILFINPLTRNKVKKSDLNFVVLKRELKK